MLDGVVVERENGGLLAWATWKELSKPSRLFREGRQAIEVGDESTARESQ